MASSLHVHPVAEQSGDKEQGICTRKKRTEEISLSKQNKWQLFSSLLLTLVSKMRMMENMNSRFGTVNWLKGIVYDSPDPQTYDPYTVSSNQPLHCSICYHGGRTWMSLSLYNNFLLMGLQTISCFYLSHWFDLWPSLCLCRVQKLRINLLSRNEKAVKGKKKFQQDLWYR